MLRVSTGRPRDDDLVSRSSAARRRRSCDCRATVEEVGHPVGSLLRGFLKSAQHRIATENIADIAEGPLS